MAASKVCPSCHATGMQPFYEVFGVPLESSVVLANRDDALDYPTGDIVLALCGGCGFIANNAHPGEVKIPSTDYEDQQGFSPTFISFAERIVADLVERYGLRGKTVLEIGCGKGDFLAMLCEAGDNRGIGVDPLLARGRLGRNARARVSAVAEVYSRKHARFEPDLILCRHTLEHIPDTRAFLETVRATLEPGRETAVVMEVPDVTRILRDEAFWDVYFEHTSYFNPGSLAHAFRSAGFAVTDLQRVYDDQYLIVHALARTPKNDTSVVPLEKAQGELGSVVERFARGVKESVEAWKTLLGDCAESTAVWGSGSKCVSFLSTLGLAGTIGAIVDINPHRHGCFIPGVGRPVEAPSTLRKMNPERIVVMNPIYRDEIEASVRGMGLGSDIVAV